ncbi:hypothetical protein [Calothrix sp. PCC 7507]|uniref:hypothetical protein n=1 Tax=Calothrix sp. PCC 7507 TaxID=99598 RepID=UPI00029F4768|nr:hypothetical protein [Calothrix sp. PCC 7507]AFY31622.1 hypothetical protein Cal7507_1148 [Calothrix sp. PCC 7507]
MANERKILTTRELAAEISKLSEKAKDLQAEIESIYNQIPSPADDDDEWEYYAFRLQMCSQSLAVAVSQLIAAEVSC